jgi:hypothetical protein
MDDKTAAVQTRKFGEADVARVFQRLQYLESEKGLDWVGA